MDLWRRISCECCLVRLCWRDLVAYLNWMYENWKISTSKYYTYTYVCVNLLHLPHFPWINRFLHIQVIGSEKLPMTRSVRRSVGPLVCHISLKCIKFKFQCSYRSTWFCLDKSSALVFALFKFLLQSTVPRFYQLFHSINYCNICIFFLLFKLCQSINCYISLLYYAN